MATIMRVLRRWKYWWMDVIPWVLLAVTENVLLAEGRRPVHGGSDSSDDDRPPVVFPTNEGTVHGHRGNAGTLGVLIIAALVIPAGIIATLYLLYVYACGQREDDLDKHMNDDSREWSALGQKGVMVTNESWPKFDDDLVLDVKQEEIFKSMPEKTDDLQVDRSELVSLMSTVVCDVTTPRDAETLPCDGDTTSCDHDTTPCDHEPCARGEGFTENGLITDPVTPVVEASVQPTNGTLRNGNLLNDPPTDEQDSQNKVEIFVTGDNETIPCDTTSSGGNSATSDNVTTNQPPTNSTPAVKPLVVNEVRLNLTFASSQKDERDTSEKYVSAVVMFLPGAQTGAESSEGAISDNNKARARVFTLGGVEEN